MPATADVPPSLWPEWCMDYQPTKTDGRLRVVWGFRFEAIEFVEQNTSGVPLVVFRDAAGRWCAAPKGK